MYCLHFKLVQLYLVPTTVLQYKVSVNLTTIFGNETIGQRHNLLIMYSFYVLYKELNKLLHGLSLISF